MFVFTLRAAVVAALTLVLSATSIGAAGADGSRLDRIERPGQRQQMLHVYSAAMDRVIPLQVITPHDTSAPRPTLYLLNGAGGGEDVANWYNQTDIVQFFGDKNVNVVTPAAGKFSYYTDWLRDDPELGRNKWQTFLTEELPPIIDATLNTTGVNAIAGLSMSATAVLNLAIAAPDRYRAVGAYSGCASVDDPLGRTAVELVLARAGADPANMWGAPGDPAWRANDPYLNAERLRGKTIYLSSATGLPGAAEALPPGATPGKVIGMTDQILLGGAIEVAANQCTQRLAARLADLNIPAHTEFRPAGTHTWKYWEQDLHKSWPLFAEAIGTE
ncbi:esterase [Nocardia neocaledoniensis NBRC 108232]|uniref:alpha/beta hydrolase n=1 Tax=Nocardia neocaledoniensis TaxID=236511 RepID=UPI000D71C36D|nr:alpha/beta hydrolase family protein [Nocardia neocaledoniensis]GEM30684.1 esterase [Nocardia neocaledoniensis NBRC 108232]